MKVQRVTNKKLPLVLVDGVQRNRENPSTFDIPTEAERQAIQPKTWVKVGFEYEAGAQPSGMCRGERMWVEVTRSTKLSTGVLYEGRLDNTPYGLPLKLNDVFQFDDRHILDILQPQPATPGEGPF